MPAWMLHVLGFVATTLILLGAAPYLGGPPWWFVFVAAVAIYAGGAVAVERILRRTFLQPWMEQGAVLRGAAVDVHAIARGVSAPAGMEVAGHTDRAWCRFDLTITPRAGASARVPWDPEDLALLDPRCQADPQAEETLDLGITVHGVEVHRDGAFAAPDGSVIGASRLRFHAALPNDWPFVRIRYCLETFGRLNLPAATSAVQRAAA